MIDVNKLPEDVQSDLFDEAGGDYNVETAKHWSVREMFEKWLGWHGIIGYTDQIMEALDGIRAAEVKDDEDNKVTDTTNRRNG
jgi:hypothetical protein